MVKRELKWFFWSFVVPMLLIVGGELALRESPVPFWRRVFTLEDACAYGWCVVAPGLIFACALFGRGFWKAWRRFRGKDAG